MSNRKAIIIWVDSSAHARFKAAAKAERTTMSGFGARLINLGYRNLVASKKAEAAGTATPRSTS